MSKLIPMMMALFLTPAIVCQSKEKINNTPVPYVDLTKFMGRWYEIARFDHTFERGMDNVTTFYSVRKDGKVSVQNSGWKNGGFRLKKAVAKIPDPIGNPGLLRVSFFLNFFSDYRILMIDDSYSYALIGGSNDKYLWIMSRTPYLDESDMTEILFEARLRGYDVNKLVWVEQMMPAFSGK